MAIITSPILSGFLALSGWEDDHKYTGLLSNQHWTQKMREIAPTINMHLPRHELDLRYNNGWEGKFYTAHAEPKLIAAYLDFYLNQRAALFSLAATTNWHANVLNIDVSDEVCQVCQELARCVYETHGIMINYTIRSRLIYPEWKNHDCHWEMRDGRRIFCEVCQDQIEKLSKIQITLPQKDSVDFEGCVKNAAGRSLPDANLANLYYEVFQAVAAIPDIGLNKYSGNTVAERRVTVIISTPRTKAMATAIDRIIKNAATGHGYPYGKKLQMEARRAVSRFIGSLEISTLTQTVGEVKDFPWTTDLHTSVKAADGGKPDSGEMVDLTTGLGKLQVTKTSNGPFGVTVRKIHMIHMPPLASDVPKLSPKCDSDDTADDSGLADELLWAIKS